MELLLGFRVTSLYRHTHQVSDSPLLFNISFVRFCLLEFTLPNLIHYTKCVVKCSKCLHMFLYASADPEYAEALIFNEIKYIKV